MLKARIVPFVVQSGLTSGTIPLSAPGLGVPQGAVFFVSGAESDQIVTPTKDYRVCIGFTDTVREGCSGHISYGELGTTSSARFNNDTACIVETDKNNVLGRAVFDSVATDVLNLAYTADAFTGSWRGFAILFAGAPDLEVFDWVSTSSGARNVVLTDAFKPDLVLLSSNLNPNYDISGTSKFGFGFSVRGAGDTVNNYGFSIENRDGLAAVRMSGRSANRDLPGPRGDRTTYVSAWNADGCTLRVMDGSGQHNGYGIAIRVSPDQEIAHGDGTTAIALGDYDFPTPYSAGSQASELFFVAHTRFVGVKHEDDTDEANAHSYGAADSSGNQALMVALDDHDNPTTQSKSFFSSQHSILIHDNGSSITQEKVGSVSNLTGGSATVNFSVADAQPRWAYWFAIQGDSAAPGEDTEVDLPAERLGLSARAPNVQVQDTINVQLPAERLALRTSAVTTSTPGGVDVETLTANTELTPREPDTRLTEHIASSLTTAQLGLTPRSPGVVVEADVDTTLPPVTLALQARPPATNDGAGDQSFLPRVPLDARASEPGVFVEFDVYTQLSTVRYRLGATAPGIYLAGDKVTTAPTARLRAMASPPRVMVGDPADMGPEDGGVLGPVITEAVVPPTEQPAVS